MLAKSRIEENHRRLRAECQEQQNARVGDKVQPAEDMPGRSTGADVPRGPRGHGELE